MGGVACVETTGNGGILTAPRDAADVPAAKPAKRVSPTGLAVSADPLRRLVAPAPLGELMTAGFAAARPHRP